MQQIKIIFFDIDGTLIGMQSKHISPRTVEALHRLRSNGIRLCIATGRAPVTLPDFGGAEFDAYLTFNGCSIARCRPPPRLGILHRPAP